MNFRYVLMAAALAFSLGACEKEDNNINTDELPQAVFEAFSNAYPDAEDVEWELEDGYYEVEFEMGNYEIEVTYDLNGNVIEIEEEIDPATLPENIRTYISTNYPDSEIEEAEMITDDDGVFYEVEIETANDEELELLFDEDGNFIEVESEDDDEDDDDDD